MKGKLILLLSTLLIASMFITIPLSTTSAVTTSTLTLSTPSKDTLISTNGWEDFNLGHNVDLSALSGPSFPWLERTLIQFSLPPELSGATITSATLTLDWVGYWSGTDPDGVILRACRITHDWIEGTGEWGDLTQDGVTWNEYDYYDGLTTATNNWNTPGGDYTQTDSTTASTSLGADTVWAVTAIVQGWVSNTYPNYGFLIKIDDEAPTASQGISFASRERTGFYFHPMLEITYIPAIEGVLEQIDDYVTDGSIDNDGIAKGLSKLLENVQEKIDQGNINAAINQLNAFIKTVQAQMGKHITVAAAQTLIDQAQDIIDTL